MTPDPTQKEITERYSRTNPPPSEEVALDTIDILNADVANIEAKLDHTTPDTFHTNDEYQVWRRRATSALGYTRQELAFLEKWVRGRRVSDSRSIYNNLDLVVQKIRLRVRELEEEIGSSYTPLYSVTAQPKSLLLARERMSHLTGVKQRLQGAFSEITAAWTEHPLRRGDMSGVKAPLQKILSKVEIEIGVVKGYLRIKEDSRNTISRDWKVVCTNAIKRAVAEGFVLTPTEQEVLAQIQLHIIESN